MRSDSKEFRQEMSLKLSSEGGGLFNNFRPDFGSSPCLVEQDQKSLWGLLKDHITSKREEGPISKAIRRIKLPKLQNNSPKKV